MKFSTVSNAFFNLVSFESELLHNKDEKRPYLIIVKLKYKGKNQDFAIPFRSNIANYIPKDQYYSLPPRYSTGKQKIHGLHYIKMFPINKKYLQKYNVDTDEYFIMIQTIVKNNIKDIVSEAQTYLTNYESGISPSYCVGIERIYYALNTDETMEETATTIQSVEDTKI